MAEYRKAFTAMTKDTLEATFGEGNAKMWHITVSPGDCLYTPAGMIMYEHVMDDQDLFGIRRGVHFVEQLEPHEAAQRVFEVQGRLGERQ